MDLKSSLDPFFVQVSSGSIFNREGIRILHNDCSALFALLGGQMLPIDRNDLQLALLPRDLIQLNKKCIDIAEHEDYVQVTFADGSTDHADLLVGADGIFSTVRNKINPNAQIERSDYSWMGGIAEKQHSNEVMTTTYLGKVLIKWPTAHGEMWYLPYHNRISNEEKFIPKNSIKNFHLPIYTLAPPEFFTTKRVVLIGDAAHALGPILGQGASLALEDVFLLYSSLKHTTNLQQTLTFYERLRKPRYKIFAELENQSAKNFISEDLTSLELLETQLQKSTLVDLYKDIAPLVNEDACLKLAAQVFYQAEEVALA